MKLFPKLSKSLQSLQNFSCLRKSSSVSSELPSEASPLLQKAVPSPGDYLPASPIKPKHKIGYTYDQRMLLSKSTYPIHEESPERILFPYAHLFRKRLLQNSTHIPSFPVSEQDILTCHTNQHLDFVKKLCFMDHQYQYPEENVPDYLKQEGTKFNRYLKLNEREDMWIHYQLRSQQNKFGIFLTDLNFQNRYHYLAALVAAGSTVAGTKAVLNGDVEQAFLLQRPPSHHAEANRIGGYCYFNNQGIAAKYAQNHLGAERVLILDIDAHHGNGIQDIFYHDPSVFYMSVHRFEKGNVYPHVPAASQYHYGASPGEFFNLNIPWNSNKPHTTRIPITDGDMLYAFHHLIVPIAQSFKPDLILLATGYDPLIGDPIGMLSLSPFSFYHITKVLRDTVSKNLVVGLEGG